MDISKNWPSKTQQINNELQPYIFKLNPKLKGTSNILMLNEGRWWHIIEITLSMSYLQDDGNTIKLKWWFDIVNILTDNQATVE